MSAISQDLARIDSAKYGEEVRGSIHHAIEQCYTDVTTAETLANTAANNANTKADLADAATTRANQAAATAENFTGLVAPTYSTSATYAVGNYVVYNGAMYRCITAIDTAEAWTAAHWTAVNTGAEVTDLKSALNLSAYCLGPVQNVDEDLYKIENTSWEQGGFNSSGDTESTVWIRTGLLLGGFLYHNKGGSNRITVARYIDSTGIIDNYVYVDNTDEWVWVPYEEGYHVRFRERKSTNITAITPEENEVTVYRPTACITTIRTELGTAEENITTLQNNVSVMQETHEQEVDNGGLLNKINGHYIKYSNGNISGDNTVFNYVEGKVAPGMILYYNVVKLGTLDSRGLAFYDKDGTFISGYQMLATVQRIVIPENAHFVRATVQSASDSTAVVLSGYNAAIENATSRIDEITDTKYGYLRNYTDITHALAWQHKTYDDSGVLVDSDYNIMAEIPNVGNIEVKMNRPYIKFRVYVSTMADSGKATMLQDWSHYFYRYTPDTTGHLHYYVVVALEGGGDTTSGAFTAGRRGIKVYTYEDSGAIVKCPDGLYGKRVAVMGDSIVQGRVRKNDAESINTVYSKPWPYMIAEACGTEPADYGIGGAQVYGTDWLSLYTNRDKITGYDVVFVCAGTNDFGAEVSEADFKAAYADVLSALKSNNTLVIAITPTSRQTNSANGDGVYLREYAQYVKDVAEAADVDVIDLFALTESNTVFRMNMPDGLHPNEIGQKIIADLVLNNMPD